MGQGLWVLGSLGAGIGADRWCTVHDGTGSLGAGSLGAGVWGSLSRGLGWPEWCVHVGKRSLGAGVWAGQSSVCDGAGSLRESEGLCEQGSLLEGALRVMGQGPWELGSLERGSGLAGAVNVPLGALSSGCVPISLLEEQTGKWFFCSLIAAHKQQ